MWSPLDLRREDAAAGGIAPAVPGALPRGGVRKRGSQFETPGQNETLKEKKLFFFDRRGPPRCNGTRVNFFRWDGADLELQIRAQPGARRTEVQGLHAHAIKIRLQARPIEGAANDA